MRSFAFAVAVAFVAIPILTLAPAASAATLQADACALLLACSVAPFGATESLYKFGTLDPQVLTGWAYDGSGVGPWTYEWDLDNDGVYSETGEVGLNVDIDRDHNGAIQAKEKGSQITSAFTVSPPTAEKSTYSVRFRVTDSTGATSTTTALVTVVNVDRVLYFRCGWDPSTTDLKSMEWSASGDTDDNSVTEKRTCWIHQGHHTYYPKGVAYRLRGGFGQIASTEVAFAPPVAADLEQTERELLNANYAPINVEISADGNSWDSVGFANYGIILKPGCNTVSVGVPNLNCLTNIGRQGTSFALPSFNDDGHDFRFMRFVNPKATEAISGYMESSWAHIYVDEIPDAPAEPAIPSGSVTLTCQRLDATAAPGVLVSDLMEDIFPEHPCTFGNTNRYQTPSLYHTYYLGPSTLDSVTFKVQVAPWRTDDYFSGSSPTSTKVYLQSSEDGRTWDLLATLDLPYGVPTELPAPLALGGKEATFVRLIPERHSQFMNYAAQPALHHPRAYFVASEITVVNGASTSALDAPAIAAAPSGPTPSTPSTSLDGIRAALRA